MGVFTRFKDIVNANINAILDKAEDPEKMKQQVVEQLNQLIRSNRPVSPAENSMP